MSGKDRGNRSAKKPAKLSLKEKRAAKREKSESESSLLNKRS